ncbi:MAG TPA: ABC transporter substrate-binding protein [Chloroflexota bacterium]
MWSRTTSRRWTALGVATAILIVACAAPAATPARVSAPAGGAPAAAQAAAPGAAAAAPQATPVEPRPLKRTTLQRVTPQVTDASEMMAIEKGFFREAGFDVALVGMRGETAAPGLVAGDLDYATNVSSMVPAALGGLPVVVTMILRAGTDWAVMARPERVREVPRDLYGKVIGTSGLGSGDYFVMSDWVATKGLDPKSDVGFVTVGGTQERLAALVSAAIDVGPLLPPFNWAAEKEGLQQVGSPSELPNSYRGGLTVSRQRLEGDRDEIKRFMKALVRGLHYVHDPSHREEVYDVLTKNLGEDREDVRRAFEFSYPILTRNGLPNLPDFATFLQGEAQRAGVTSADPLADVADFRPLDEVLSEVGRLPE